MTPELVCGCSGYYYPAWKGSFYPSEMKPPGFLKYYSEKLPALELNSSFRNVPSEKTLQRLFSETPDDFRIVVKMNRRFTHFGKPLSQTDEIRAFRDRIQDHLRQKLAGFLFQFPPSFRCNEENTDELRSLGTDPLTFIELRHSSWLISQTDEKLAAEGLQLVTASFPGLETKIYGNQSRQYYRFHGIPELFKSSYSDAELKEWIGKIPADSETVFAFFNNTVLSDGAENALHFIKLYHQYFKI